MTATKQPKSSKVKQWNSNKSTKSSKIKSSQNEILSSPNASPSATRQTKSSKVKQNQVKSKWDPVLAQRITPHARPHQQQDRQKSSKIKQQNSNKMTKSSKIKSSQNKILSSPDASPPRQALRYAYDNQDQSRQGPTQSNKTARPPVKQENINQRRCNNGDNSIRAR